MRYAIIPEFPEAVDLEPLADIVCDIIGLPQEDAHPSSVSMGSDILVKIYEAIFNAYGVPTQPHRGEIHDLME